MQNNPSALEEAVSRVRDWADSGWTVCGTDKIREDLRLILDALAAQQEPAKLDDDGYLWKWIERGLFDQHVSAKEALDVIAWHPAAPWKNGRWDVDHRPYAKTFYAKFPRALANGGGDASL